MTAMHAVVEKHKSQSGLWIFPSQLPDRSKPLGKILDISIMAMLAVFFAGYVNIHSDIVGLPRFFPMPGPVEEFWEVFSWIIFAALSADICLKYRKINDPKAFAKKHWPDVVMLALIPVFAGFKVAKLSVKIVKGLKMGKSGFKAFQSTKKISAKNSEAG